MSSKDDELRALQEKCRMYESWLRALDEYADFDLWFKNTDSEYQYVNQKFEQAMGRGRDELIGLTPADIFSDAGRQQRVYDLDKRILDKGLLQRTVPCDGSGALQMHEERRFPVLDEHGQISGLGCIALEVSKQSFAEEALNQAQTIAQMGNWRWSIKEQCLLSCSDQFAMLLGVSTPEAFALMHQRLERVVYPDDRAIVKAILDRRPEEHSPYQIEYRIVRADGEIRYVLEIAQPMIGNGGIAVEYAGILQDITAQKHTEIQLRETKEKLEARVEERTRHLKYMASHDSLTGLLNRNAYFEEFKQHMQRRCDESPITVVALDLDGFKLVNDSHGHMAGDTVLKTVAMRLLGSIKPGDIAVRLGGDEFALILFDLTDPVSDSRTICLRLKETLCAPISIDNISVRIGCSFGIHSFTTSEVQQEDLEQAIAKADIALYKSKMNKGLHYSVFEEQMGKEVAQRQKLENDFRLALVDQQLYVEYQPQVSVQTGEFVGVEALARWHHPELGLISPDVFITIAEDCGLIDDLCEIVLLHSCKALKDIHTVTGDKDIKVAVNFSAIQFYNEHLLLTIQNVLQQNDLLPKHMDIEITESLFVKNPVHTKSLLDTMRALGFSVSLDDFGTGYSALGYLQEFEVDTIKLDRSFVKKISSQQSNKKIVQGIIRLAKSIGLTVVAEGVEYPEQDLILRSLGCDIAQGYLHGKPMNLNKLLAFLSEAKHIKNAAS